MYCNVLTWVSGNQCGSLSLTNEEQSSSDGERDDTEGEHIDSIKESSELRGLQEYSCCCPIDNNDTLFIPLTWE